MIIIFNDGACCNKKLFRQECKNFLGIVNSSFSVIPELLPIYCCEFLILSFKE